MNDLTREKRFSYNVLEHIDALKYFALSLSKNEFDADDLVSETIIKAFENFSRLKDESKLKSWLFRILSNLFISNYRRKKKLIEIDNFDSGNGNDNSEFFSLFEAISKSDYIEEGDPEIKFIRELNRKQIEKAINELPVQFRMTLILCDIENFSYAEISKMMNIPVGTVRSRIARARSILQSKLWILAQELGIQSTKYPKKKKSYVCNCGKDSQSPDELNKIFESDLITN